MYFITRPVVVALIVGSLGFLGYELWSRAPDWAKGTVFAQSPALLGMVLLFFGAAILIFVVCRRLFSRKRKRNALR
jgi:ABC-type dipeptide/oligopeptide/nickel transport system permease subunit